MSVPGASVFSSAVPNSNVFIAATSANFSIPTLSFIGPVQVDTTIEEDYEDRLELTEHPVEAGAMVVDHSFKRPMEVRLRCGWSDSSVQALLGNVAALQSGFFPFTVTTGSFIGGAMRASDYVAGIYSQLLQLQESRAQFSVSTGMRIYNNMLMVSLRVRRDQATKYVLMVEAECRQVIFVNTTASAVAPQANMAQPQNTASQVAAGAVTPAAGVPAPGGSYSLQQATIDAGAL